MEKTPWARWHCSVLVSMVLLVGFGCGGSGTKGDKGTGGASGRVAADDGGVGAGSAGKAGSLGTGLAGANAGSSGSGGSTQVCYVDFPCRYAYRCVGSDSYQAQETIGCQEVCPPGPCSGAMCRSSGSPIACPAGTRCMATDGFDNISTGCQKIPDAGAGDARLKDPADAPASEVGSMDAQTADRGVKPPLDAFKMDTSQRQPVDAVAPDVAPICVAGERRCKDDIVLQTCEAGGQYWNSQVCDYACRDGACVGECEPGVRRRCRATGNTPQACASTSTWVDEPACSGNTPYCATGECVAACLSEGQDCSASTTACCAGTECIASNGNTDIMIGSSKFVCKAIPACAALGAACSANTDCCAGLDCAAGKCAAKQTTCLDAPADGVCGGTSGATCCPGTECGHMYSFEPLGCMIPSTTRPQEIACPREQPALHEACRAAQLGLQCRYSDWSKANGVFFTCTCSYHGWSCTKGYYVH